MAPKNNPRNSQKNNATPSSARPPSPWPDASEALSKRTGTPALTIDTGSSTNAPAALPLTPPRSDHTAPSADTPMAALDENTTSAIDALLKTNQETLHALGSTFELLGQHTIMIATLGPALAAMAQIETLRKEVVAHGRRQDAEVERVDARIKAQVDEQVREGLRAAVDKMVAEAIQGAIAARVQDALKARVTEEHRKKIEAYRRRIEEVRIKLENEEAKRWNAQIRRETQGVPLRPLLRPIGATGAPSVTHARGNSKGQKKPRDASSGGSQDGSADAGTPSEVFPKYVGDIPGTSARDARRLVVEYGIKSSGADGDEEWEDLGDEMGASAGAEKNAARGANDRGGGGNGGGKGGSGIENAKNEAKEQKKREKEEKEQAAREAKLAAREAARAADLNAFMRYIGLGHLYMLPPAPTGAGMLRSPLMERAPFSFLQG